MRGLGRLPGKASDFQFRSLCKLIAATFIAMTSLMLNAPTPAVADSVDLSGGTSVGFSVIGGGSVEGYITPLLTVPTGDTYDFTVTLNSFALTTGSGEYEIVTSAFSYGSDPNIAIQIGNVEACVDKDGINTCPDPYFPPPVTFSFSSTGQVQFSYAGDVDISSEVIPPAPLPTTLPLLATGLAAIGLLTSRGKLARNNVIDLLASNTATSLVS